MERLVDRDRQRPDAARASLATSSTVRRSRRNGPCSGGCNGVTGPRRRTTAPVVVGPDHVDVEPGERRALRVGQHHGVANRCWAAGERGRRHAGSRNSAGERELEVVELGRCQEQECGSAETSSSDARAGAEDIAATLDWSIWTKLIQFVRRARRMRGRERSRVPVRCPLARAHGPAVSCAPVRRRGGRGARRPRRPTPSRSSPRL